MATSIDVKSTEKGDGSPSRFWRSIREHGSLVVEIITVLGGIAAFAVDQFITIPPEKLTTMMIGLLALLAVGALLERVTKLNRVDKHLSEVYDQLATGGLVRELSAIRGRSDALVERLNAVGITWTYVDLHEAAIGQKLRRAKSIRVLTTWMGNLTEHEWTLTQAAEANCEIKILMLRHDSIYAKMRSKELGLEQGSGPKRIKEELITLERMRKESEGVRRNLSVRAYSGIPIMYLIAYDACRLLGLLWRNRMAIATPFLEVKGVAPEIARIIDEHFNKIWHDPNTKSVKIVNGEPRYEDDPG